MQVLTLYRFGSDWAFRDVTGEIYGRSDDIRDTFEAAQHMARRIGARVEFSSEAEIHWAATASRSVDNEASPSPKSRHGFRAAFARLLARRRRK